MDQNIMPNNNFQQTPKQSKQISTLIGLTIIIVVAVILFGGAFAYLYFTTKAEQPIVEVQQTQNQNNTTAGWKTYTNTQYGFEIKYSANFTVSEDSGVVIFSIRNGISIAYAGFSIYSDNSANGLNFCRDKQNVTGTKNLSGNIFDVRSYKVGQAIGGSVVSIVDYTSIHNSYCFILRSEFLSGSQAEQADIDNITKELDDMLSTFKFTK